MPGPYPAVQTFFVERVNEVTVHRTRPLEDRCARPGCESCANGWDDTLFDVRRVDTGEILKTGVWHMGGGLPPGALWLQQMTDSPHPSGPDDWAGYTPEELARVRASFAEHPDYYRQGPSPADPTLPARGQSYLFADGPQLTVICPNGHQWVIDSRASNCALPYEYGHRCWVRHGDPRTQPITVDKNGPTCAAGGGSIMAGDYHGFLTNGILTAG